MASAQDRFFDPPRKRHTGLIFLLFFLILALGIIFVMNTINNSRVALVRQSVTLPNLPGALEGTRILHISDLHGLEFGPEQSRLKQAIDGTHYNLVVVTGDITGKDGDISAFIDLVRLFDGIAPVYFIPGDEDPDPLVAVPHESDSALNGYIVKAVEAGAIYLDAPVKIEIGSGSFWLAPEWFFSLDAEASQKALEKRYDELLKEAPSMAQTAALIAVEYQLEQAQRIHQARLSMLSSDISIALTHHPLQRGVMDTMQAMTGGSESSYSRSISLILAGHYAAGQWRLPFVGAVKAPQSAGLGDGWFPGDENVVGLNTVIGISQYISPGLGASSASGLPAFRLFNTPSVTLITLTSRLI